jgi:Domain of unknown function (DUF4214)
MKWYRKLFAPSLQTALNKQRRTRLQLEALEERTVLASFSVLPLDQAINNTTTFHLLQDAVNAATSTGDVITIEPGATADLSPVTVNSSSLTITGDPNVPGSILPSYDIVVNASNVTLTHMNLGTVTVNPDFSNDAVTHATVNTIDINGGTSGAGNMLINENAITGSVSVTGVVGSPMLNIQVTNNTINTVVSASTSPIINIQDASNVFVANNSITGGGSSSQIGIQINRGTSNIIANNTLTLSGADLNTEGIVLENSGFDPLTSVTVRNNTIATGSGCGLSINALNDVDMEALVQGNDFHDNAVGVEYTGANSTSLSSDLGGGTSNLGTSLGANDFRGFPAQGTATNAAIVLQNVANGAVLSAQDNLFTNPADAQKAVFVVGSGSINVSQELDANHAFVQALYNELLGRSGTMAELNYWVGVMQAGGKNGQTNVVNDLLRSTESLDHIVDQYYLEYLGRTADAAGQTYWVNQIQAGMTLEQVQAGFLSSQEFISNDNSDYIQALFLTVLGRTGSADDLAYWEGQLMSVGYAGVAKTFVNLKEYDNDVTAALFSKFLHRAPSAGDLSYWSAQFGDLLSVEVKLLSTSEYFTNG